MDRHEEKPFIQDFLYYEKRLIRKKIRSPRGFTLIELLLAASLLLAVFSAIGASFIQGARIFSRFEYLSAQENTAFFFERITHDLKNCTPSVFAPFSVAASKDSVSFATLVSVPVEGDNLFDARLVQVAYRYDKDNREILRIENDPFAGPDRQRTDVLVKNISSLKFSFFPEEAKFPSRVDFEAGFDSPSGERTFEKSVLIPVTA